MHDEKTLMIGAAGVALLLLVVLVRQAPRAGLVGAEVVSAGLSAAFALPVPDFDAWGHTAPNIETLPALTACAVCVGVASFAKNAPQERRSALAVGVVGLAIAIGGSSILYGLFNFILMAFRGWKLVLIPALLATQLAAVIQAGRQA